MVGFTSVQGEVFASDKACIPALDRFFLFGDGVYEIIAAKNGQLLDFQSHLGRLRESCEIAHIEIPWPDEQLRFEMESLMSLNPSPRQAIRLIVSRGLGQSPKVRGSESTRRYIFCQNVEENIDPTNLAVKLKTLAKPSVRRGAHLKTNNYLDAISTLINPEFQNWDDVCWINREGEISESGFANIFLICREGDLVEIATPPIEAGILPGITRSRIIQLLNSAGIPVTERPITSDELARFDEGFLTSSVRGLTPIQKINHHSLHTTRRNSVFREIFRLYKIWEESIAGGISHEGGSSELN